MDNKILEKGFVRSMTALDGERGVVGVLVEVIVPVKADAAGKEVDILLHPGSVVLSQGGGV